MIRLWQTDWKSVMRVKKTTDSRQKKVKGNKKTNPPLPPFTKGRRAGITDSKTVTIHGVVKDQRVPSRLLEEQIQQAVKDGARKLHIIADGQHGIGGRIWPIDKTIKITIEGTAGQRLGSMGMPGTDILVKGSASDDVGWINCGANITVLGDVTNGAFNAAAQGILYVQGSGGARCDTMTKHNPRFDPPQSWYFRNVGDSFAEFKAGGIAVVCGINPRNPSSILGYRPCVGMVGGTIYFRGPIQEFSERDVKLLDLVLRIRGIRSDEQVSFFADEPRIKFPNLIIDSRVIPKRYNYYFVESGVKQVITYITKIPSSSTASDRRSSIASRIAPKRVVWLV